MPLESRSTHKKLILFFILVFASGGMVRPFVNIYLLRTGLNTSQIGFLHSGIAILIVVVTPLIGWWADLTRKHRTILGGIVALKAFSSALIPVFRSIWLLASMVAIRDLSSKSHDALMNRLTFEANRRSGGFGLGSIRMWGAASFVIGSYGAGILSDAVSISILFPIAGILALLSCLLLGGFPDSLERHTLQIKHQSEDSFLKRIGLSGPLVAVIFIFTFAVQGSEVFAFVYVSQSLLVSDRIIGLLGASAGAGEVAALMLADHIFRKIGPRSALLFTLATCIFGWTGMVVFRHPGLIALFLFIQRGSAAGFYLIALITLLDLHRSYSSSGIQQMLAQVTFPGVAAIIGQPVGGMILQKYGGQILFSFYIVLTFSTIMLVLAFRSSFAHSPTHRFRRSNS